MQRNQWGARHATAREVAGSTLPFWAWNLRLEPLYRQDRNVISLTKAKQPSTIPQPPVAVALAAPPGPSPRNVHDLSGWRASVVKGLGPCRNSLNDLESA